MRLILLTQGAHAVVDDVDYDRLSRFKWKLIKDGDRRYAYREDGKTLIGMHQDILGVKQGVLIDHRNGDGLNNTRSNLRYATRSQNQANSTRRKSSNASSRYKGVSLDPARWIARIKVGRKPIYVGAFLTEEAAARAYDAAAREHFREFAEVNFPNHESRAGGLAEDSSIRSCL